MSGIPGFGGEDHYEEPVPPHDEDEPEGDPPRGNGTAAEGSNAVQATIPHLAVNGTAQQNEQPTPAAQPQKEREEGMLEDDSDSEDDDFVVTIGEVKTNIPFTSAPKVAAGSAAGKLDIDGTALINGQPIYDLDLATMEDRPWRKPGSDITDYFNYGFCEETWNSYCERQRKLRAEYGTQAAVNKAIFSSISLANPISQPTMMAGGRQLQVIPILGQEKSTMDLSGFKVSSAPVDLTPQPVMRTVLTAGQPPRTIGSGGTSGTLISNSALAGVDSEVTSSPHPSTPTTIDFSKPPPMLDSTKSVSSIPTLGSLSSVVGHSSAGDGPPGVDEPAPPGSCTPPNSFDMGQPRQIPTLGGALDTSMPPPTFNPLLPPPGMGAPPPSMRLTLPNTHVPPPGFSVPPPGFNQPPPGFPPQRFPPPGTGVSPGMARPPPLMSRPAYPPPGVEPPRRESREGEDRERDRDRERTRDSGDSESEEYSGSSRRRYRRRSRSYSPRSSSRHHRDDRERDRDRDRDSDRYREKGERDRESRSSRKHRSRSGSPYESSRSSRKKEEREKEKEKKKSSRDKEKDRDDGDQKDKERKERDRDREGSERGDRDKERRKRRHNKSDDEGGEKKERDRKKVKVKEEPLS